MIQNACGDSERLRLGDKTMGLSKVQSRGQVTIPADVRRAAGLAAGDVVVIEAAGKGKVQLVVLSVREPLDHVFRRYGGPGAVAPDLWDEVAEDIERDALNEPTAASARQQAPPYRTRRARRKNR
jgi:AbrB family looped-hinge helix DNA binding protein